MMMMMMVHLIQTVPAYASDPCPSYLAALVSSSADNCRRPGLRSASSSGYLKARTTYKTRWTCLFFLRSSGVEQSHKWTSNDHRHQQFKKDL